jgi:hypothetical protein
VQVPRSAKRNATRPPIHTRGRRKGRDRICVVARQLTGELRPNRLPGGWGWNLRRRRRGCGSTQRRPGAIARSRTPKGAGDLNAGALEHAIDLPAKIVHGRRGPPGFAWVAAGTNAGNFVDACFASRTEAVGHQRSEVRSARTRAELSGVATFRDLKPDMSAQSRESARRARNRSRSGGWTRTTDSAIMSRLLCP